MTFCLVPSYYYTSSLSDGNVITFDLEGTDLSTECESLIGDKKQLLKHPLLETFLDTKWMTIRKYYIFNLTIYLICLCTFTFLIQNHLDWLSQKKNIFIFTYEVPKDYHHKIFICGYLVTILMVFYLTFREITQLFTLKKWVDYLQLGNLLDLGCNYYNLNLLDHYLGRPKLGLKCWIIRNAPRMGEFDFLY